MHDEAKEFAPSARRHAAQGTCAIPISVNGEIADRHVGDSTADVNDGDRIGVIG